MITMTRPRRQSIESSRGRALWVETTGGASTSAAVARMPPSDLCRPLRLCLAEKRLCVSASLPAVGIAQHPRQLYDTVLTVNECHLAGGHARTGRFRHEQIAIGPGCDLGKMSDHQDLTPIRHGGTGG